MRICRGAAAITTGSNRVVIMSGLRGVEVFQPASVPTSRKRGKVAACTAVAAITPISEIVTRAPPSPTTHGPVAH